MDQSKLKDLKAVKIILLFLVVLLWINMSAQKKPKKKILKYNSEYIQDLSDPFSPYTLLNNKFNKFKIENSEHDLTGAFSPNTNINWGLGFNYKWIGLSLSFGLPLANRDTAIYGRTTKTGFRLNFTTQEFLIDTYFQLYRGFYLQNPGNFYPNWTIDDPYPQRPDVGTINIGWNMLYVTNSKKYSAKAAYTFNQRQKRSAGSALIGPFYSLFFFTGDEELIPQSYPEEFAFKPLTKGFISNFGVAVGYTYSIVYNDLLISLGLVPGLGLQTNKLYNSNNKRFISEAGFAGKVLTRLAFVYNYENYFLGFTYKSNSISFTHTEESIKNKFTYNVGEVRFSLGMRIYGKKGRR